MSIDLKQSPRLIQNQRLILNQEQQLFLKLIQMTSLELKEYVETQLEENPALEEDFETNSKEEQQAESPDEIDLIESYKDTFNNDDSFPHLKDNFYDQDSDYSWENNISSDLSLLDYLKWQLSVSSFTQIEKMISSIIIGNTDEDGYLKADKEEIMKEFYELISSFNSEIYENESFRSINRDDFNKLLQDTLFKIQKNFDPVGVCARNLKECLSIQSENIGIRDGDLVRTLIDNYLEYISKDNIEQIAIELVVPLDNIRNAVNIISTLEPKPGRPFYIKDTEKDMEPDYHIYKIGNELQIQYKNHIPRLRISNYYKKLIYQSISMSPETKKFLKEKLESAKRVIKGIQERESAIFKVLKKIVDVQRDFFFYGNNFIKPLRLKDVAEDENVNVHESTVSRITSKRYISTPNGVIPLRSLFSRKIETKHGPDVSFERVKSIIEDLISNEKEDSPYSDEDISKILEIRNIKLARRTVAKYRKLLNIPSSSKRAKNISTTDKQ